MSAPDPNLRYPYADYRSWVESTDKRYERLEGDRVMVPAPTTLHQQVLRKLGFSLVRFVKAATDQDPGFLLYTGA